MKDLIQKALTAKRESKHVEFKTSFNPNSGGEWCELVKDLAAMANSGGGIIVFGLDSFGVPTGESIEKIKAIDPSEIANKVAKYTGFVDFECDIRMLKKKRNGLIAFIVKPVSVPLVFEKPGTYDIGSGKQHTAFSVGTVYFRHYAKSEPGTSEDIQRVIERKLENIRKSWIRGVRKVVQAPNGSQIFAVQPSSLNAQQFLAAKVRAVNDPNAIPVRLTRDSSKSAVSFVHEEISNGIFDEINNVIDANRILARGQRKFLLGQSIYYQIYAERHHVRQPHKIISLLLYAGIADFYAPALFWAISLPNKFIVQILTDLYLYPTNRHVHYLMRVGLLLGSEFAQWLFGKWHDKWKGYTQPPAFYWIFEKMISDMKETDDRILASRLSLTGRVGFEGEASTPVKDILHRPDQAAIMVSKACMKVFEGDNEYRSLARSLDFIAYGPEVQKRSPSIVKAIIKIIGDRKPGDMEGQK